MRFDQLALVSATTEENVAVGRFFGDILGLDVDGDPADGYAEVKAGAVTIGLHRGAMIDAVGPLGGTLVGFACDDVRGTVEAIRARGGTIALEPTETDWGTITAYVAGPHGILVELHQPA